MKKSELIIYCAVPALIVIFLLISILSGLRLKKDGEDLSTEQAVSEGEVYRLSDKPKEATVTITEEVGEPVVAQAPDVEDAYSYMDIEGPTITQINLDVLLETGLSQAAAVSFPYFMDEYITMNPQKGIWSTYYMDGSYAIVNDTEWIRVYIEEIPDIYYTCGWNETQLVWMFNAHNMTELPSDVSDYTDDAFEVTR